ncbi:MAG: DNA translocase FtsK [Chitinophagales bacterium]|nr:MAG: DNA translocase FtsK [Chitinophagales bacterium]
MGKNEKDKSQKKKGVGFIGSLRAAWNDQRIPKVIGLTLVFIAVLLAAAFISYLFNWKTDQAISPRDMHAANQIGRIGAIAAEWFFKDLFGITSFVFIPIIFFAGIRLITRRPNVPLLSVCKYSLLALLWFPLFFAFIFQNTSIEFPWSGAFGNYLNERLHHLIGWLGTFSVLLFTLLAFLIIRFNFSFHIPAALKARFARHPEVAEETEVKKWEEAILAENVAAQQQDSDLAESLTEDQFTPQSGEKESPPEPELEVVDVAEEESAHSSTKQQDEDDELPLDIAVTKEEEFVTENQTVNYDPTLDLPDYRYPPLDLLKVYGDEKITIDKEELEKNKNQIIETLRNYSIEISKIKATVGPTVTLYEIVPAAGVRISKIRNLEDDIALSLAALGIRIIAPIPGKGTIGIEVPNVRKEIVSMRSMLASEKFQNTRYDLPIALGKNIANEIIIEDLAKMPHLLVAGATGQGKSVGLNAILISLLYKKHPSQLKFVLVDPKMVELSIFKTIEKHFLARLPNSEEVIITDTKKVIHTLNALCIEMDERFSLLTQCNARNIKEYNAKFIARRLNPLKGHKFLPYIVLVIDEFADLIMTAGKEIETPIARLAQKARAVGIHLIIATQRPSVNIITGTIKANFPARIAFKVTSKVDSRTIIDVGGADQLIGRGDMLLASGSDLVRLQCAFVDTPEVENVVNFIASQRGYPEAFLLPEYIDDKDDSSGSSLDPNDRDEKFEEAARLIVSTQQGSTSLLQRRLNLGYNRAGRVMDQLEACGIVGPNQGSKPREVLIKDLAELERFLTQEKKLEKTNS